MGRHVVYDHANVEAGLRRHVGDRRLRVVELLEALEGGGAASRAFLAFEDPDAEPLYAKLRLMGYDTYLVERPDAGASGNVGAIANAIVAHAVLDADDEEDQVLVLASDDVAEDGFGTSLPVQAARALSWGWRVEVWSWSTEPIAEYLEMRSAGSPVRQLCLSALADRVVAAAGDGTPRATGPEGRTADRPAERRTATPDPMASDVSAIGAEQPWV